MGLTGSVCQRRQCAAAFKTKKIDKGVAFPTCISVNNIVCHHCPLEAEDSLKLAAGDSIKIDLGCHLDGYIAVVSHTAIVTEAGALEAAPTESGATATAAAAAASSDGAAAGGSATASADAILQDVASAAFVAAEVALRLIKPGNTNTQVTAMFKRVAAHFGVKPMQGQLSHQLKRYIIDGSQVIAARDEPDDEVEEFTFGPHEVYAVDVAMTSGEGKPREAKYRTTVFKRAAENSYSLRMKASRWLLTEVAKRFTAMPFSLRALGDVRQARLGVVECLSHTLLHSYPVLEEKEGAHVAHFKFTAMMLPAGTLKATGLALPAALRSSKMDSLPEDIKTLLETPSHVSKSAGKKKTKKRRGKRTTKAGDDAADDEEDADGDEEAEA